MQTDSWHVMTLTQPMEGRSGTSSAERQEGGMRGLA
jgi:hypothetical protein